MGDKITVRPSGLSNYLACPRSGWIQDNPQHVDENRLNPRHLSINAKVGSCVHDLISRAKEDTRSMVEDWFNRNVVNDSSAQEELVMSKTIESVEDAMRAANNVLSSFKEHGLMEVFGEAEHIHEGSMKKDYQLKSGRVMHLRGRLDLYRPSEKEVIDVKTSGQAAPGYHGAQMAAYSLLLRDVKGIDTEKATVYFARMNKQIRPGIVKQTYDAKVNRRHLHQVIQVIETADNMAGETRDARKVVASPGCWKCSAQWCRAFDTPYCPETHTTTVNSEKQQ